MAEAIFGDRKPTDSQMTIDTPKEAAIRRRGRPPGSGKKQLAKKIAVPANMEKYSFYFDPSLAKRMRVYCAEHRLSYTQVASEAIEAYLSVKGA